MDKYDLADKDYCKIISIDPGSVIGYMGIGRNANAEKRYDDAIEQFNYVTRLASDYSSGYSETNPVRLRNSDAAQHGRTL